MADLNIALFPDNIQTTGLGSCVGVVLYDATSKMAGMAHVMLPSSDLSRQDEITIAKYADTAIPELIKIMKENNANVQAIKAKIAGGAQMFAFQTKNEAMRIGPRNVDACKFILAQNNIPIIVEDTGGNFGRTLIMNTDTGLLSIRTVNQGTKEV